MTTSESFLTTAEKLRLEEARTMNVPWKKWGPYLSERQWGTVREDYSPNGAAWEYLNHDQARSRAYRWGEDGIAGFSDENQLLCFCLALWNGQDPILKERLFGLTTNEGNHGEDVKEVYFYADCTPTHSYQRYLYKYPQKEFPYDRLVHHGRDRSQPELELLDTGIFAENRYFDVVLECAKATPEDLLFRVRVTNRGPDPAVLYVLPQLWFRNTWARSESAVRPILREAPEGRCVVATHPDLGVYHFAVEGEAELLFTENETNTERAFGTPNAQPYVKDAFHEYLVRNKWDAVNPERVGTKVAAVHRVELASGATAEIRFRLRRDEGDVPFFDETFNRDFDQRRSEADEFYDAVVSGNVSAEDRNIIRQALSGMLWNKQFYFFDMFRWLKEHSADPMTRHPKPITVRNYSWFHLSGSDVISMPDKWEYPWFAAWDLAFHAIPLALVDIDLAKEQLLLLMKQDYMHLNGQMPAYETNFSDVNPPVHAMAAYYVFGIERESRGEGDLAFLKEIFHKSALNFMWWVNRKDPHGKNVFEGGFLGLDNIGVFDRSQPIPGGGHLEQADGTAWMAFYSQSMLNIAVELASHDPVYETFAIQYFEQFMWIAGAMDRLGQHEDELWDEKEGMFYDVLRYPNGHGARLKVRSMISLLPLCASFATEAHIMPKLPHFNRRMRWFIENHPELTANVTLPTRPGMRGRFLTSLVNETKLRRILGPLLDEAEFLSPFGIRSLSRRHGDEPFRFRSNGDEFTVGYEPGESRCANFGGNANWRGPIWFPVNHLIIRGLLQLYSYYGDDFKVPIPSRGGEEKTLFDIAMILSERLAGIFRRGKDGKRPMFPPDSPFQSDPNWKDLLLFYEYFDGDTGQGLGANHQTGWTGLVASIMHFNTVPGLREHILMEGFRSTAIAAVAGNV